MTVWESLLDTTKRFWYRYVVVSLLLALVAGIWLEWREEQAAAVKRIENAYESLKESEQEWLNSATAIISKTARPNAAYPERESLTVLYDDVRETIDQLTSFYAPTQTIEHGARDYRNALFKVSGAINLYEPNDESLTKLLDALQHAANAGGDFKQKIDSYRTDAWRSFFSVIL